MIHPECLELVKEFEGLYLKPYLCPAGVWTVGWGATTDLHGKRITSNSPPIDVSTAETLLERDLLTALKAVRRLIYPELSPLQEGALISFTFNLGSGQLAASTLRKRVNAFDWEDVPFQLSRWIMAGGVPQRGLKRRRAAEAAMWQRGTNVHQN